MHGTVVSGRRVQVRAVAVRGPRTFDLALCDEHLADANEPSRLEFRDRRSPVRSRGSLRRHAKPRRSPARRRTASSRARRAQKTALARHRDPASRPTPSSSCCLARAGSPCRTAMPPAATSARARTVVATWSSAITAASRRTPSSWCECDEPEPAERSTQRPLTRSIVLGPPIKGETQVVVVALERRRPFALRHVLIPRTPARRAPRSDPHAASAPAVPPHSRRATRARTRGSSPGERSRPSPRPLTRLASTSAPSVSSSASQSVLGSFDRERAGEHTETSEQPQLARRGAAERSTRWSRAARDGAPARPSGRSSAATARRRDARAAGPHRGGSRARRRARSRAADSRGERRSRRPAPGPPTLDRPSCRFRPLGEH